MSACRRPVSVLSVVVPLLRGESRVVLARRPHPGFAHAEGVIGNPRSLATDISRLADEVGRWPKRELRSVVRQTVEWRREPVAA
jgi:nucleoside-diphosphate-sugar epimerase